MKLFPSPLFLLCLLAAPAWGQFSIDFTFAGSIAPDEQEVIRSAADVWEDHIIGYLPGSSPTGSTFLTGVTINVTDLIPGDGVGGAVVGDSGPGTAFFHNGFFLPTVGTVEFDPSDIDLVNHMELLLHAQREIGHVLGVGTLWSLNGLYTPGSGEYLGPAALEAYRSEFDPTAAFVPVELGGLGNIPDGHWNELDFGLGLTGLTDAFGRDFGNDLMTAWNGPDSSEAFLSETTVMSLQDLGYLVQYAAPNIPEPSILLLGPALLLVLLARRRRT